jgi:hypothetical protein
VIFQLSTKSRFSQRMIKSRLPVGGTLARNAAPAKRGNAPAAGLLALLLLLLALLLFAAAESRMYLWDCRQGQ